MHAISSGAAFAGPPAPGGGSAWLQRPGISLASAGPQRFPATVPCAVAGPARRCLAGAPGLAAVAVVQMLMIVAAPPAAGGWGSRRGSARYLTRVSSARQHARRRGPRGCLTRACARLCVRKQFARQSRGEPAHAAACCGGRTERGRGRGLSEHDAESGR